MHCDLTGQRLPLVVHYDLREVEARDG
jgi:hypothetical protein